LAEPNRRHY